MECPNCQHPIQEKSGQCPHCEFSIDQLRAHFGPPPTCHRGLNDFASLFSEKEILRLGAAVDRLSRRFPQVASSIVTTRLGPGQSVHLWAFYLLNESGLCAFFQQGGRARDVLLVLDSTTKEAALTISYGLEPFISLATLQESLDAGHHHFMDKSWAKGIETVLEALERRMEAIALALPPTYGITPADWQPPTGWPHPRDSVTISL